MPLDMEVGLSPGDFVLDRDPAPSPKRGGAPNFRPTSIVTKLLHGTMPLGTDVSFGLRDVVLDGDPAPPPLNGHSPLNFRPMSVVAKRLDGVRYYLVWR